MDAAGAAAAVVAGGGEKFGTSTDRGRATAMIKKTRKAYVFRPPDYLYIRSSGPREVTEELRLSEDDGPNHQATSQTRVQGIPRREEPLNDG